MQLLSGWCTARTEPFNSGTMIYFLRYCWCVGAGGIFIFPPDRTLLGHSVDGEIKDSLKEATALVLQQKGAELAHAVSMYVEDMKELESVRKNLLQALGKELPENSPLHEAVDQWAELVRDAVLKKYNANPARAGSGIN